MYKMHIYRDGILPTTQQGYYTAGLEILRFDYWVVQLWNHANLAAPYWRLYWNREAGAEVQLREERFALTPECLLLIAPNTPFTTRFSGADAGEQTDNLMIGCPIGEWVKPTRRGGRIVHHFFTHFLAGTPYDTLSAHIFPFTIDNQSRELIQLILHPMADNRQQLNRQQSLALCALLHLALSHVPDELWPSPQTDERIKAVLNFIDQHFDQRLTNEDFAPIAAMSAKAFVRLFKAHTHQTPLEYLQHKRLEKASILLHHANDSIERIAEQCGFYDRHHFTKLFQRVFGIGPAAYRKRRMP